MSYVPFQLPDTAAINGSTARAVRFLTRTYPLFKRQHLLLALCGALCMLAGCCWTADSPRSEKVKNHPSVVGRIRTDGIYECRGVQTVSSAGGWSFLHFPPPHVRLAYFIRFYPTGRVNYTTAREPFTTGEAGRYLDSLGNTRQGSAAPYVQDGPRVRFTIGDEGGGGPVVHCDGTLTGDELVLKWWSSDVPAEVNVFRFVKWP